MDPSKASNAVVPFPGNNTILLFRLICEIFHPGDPTVVN